MTLLLNSKASQRELGADLTDWLFAYQAEDSFEHSYTKWKSTGSLAWLIAALCKVKKDAPQAEELLAAADQVKFPSPAYATLRYHQISLLQSVNKKTEANQKLDEVFTHLSAFPQSTKNDFYSLKTLTADNLDDFLKYSQRQAATSFGAMMRMKKGTI